MRKAADDAFTLAGLSYRVKCEIESLTTLNAALAADLGGTIMPESAARTMLQPANAWMARIVEPNVLTSLSFCMSDHLPLSQPAEAVKGILLSLMAQRTEDNRPLTLVDNKSPLSPQSETLLSTLPIPALESLLWRAAQPCSDPCAMES